MKRKREGDAENEYSVAQRDQEVSRRRCCPVIQCINGYIYLICFFFFFFILTKVETALPVILVVPATLKPALPARVTVHDPAAAFVFVWICEGDGKNEKVICISTFLIDAKH